MDLPHSLNSTTTTTTTNSSNSTSPLAKNNNHNLPIPLSRDPSSSNSSYTTTPTTTNTISSNNKPQRRKHKNSHLGCSNCKKRRIKCDESLPQCNNCIKFTQAKVPMGLNVAKCSYLMLSENELVDWKIKKAQQYSSTPVQAQAAQAAAAAAAVPSHSSSQHHQQQAAAAAPKPGRPLNSHTNHEITTLSVYPNKSPFFKKKVTLSSQLSNELSKNHAIAFDKDHYQMVLENFLVKLLLLSEICDLYFQALCNFSCNYLAKCLEQDRELYHKMALSFFGNCINIQRVMLSKLSKLSPCHFQYLTSATALLTWCSLYQEKDLNAYSSFATGILSIISNAVREQMGSNPNTMGIRAVATNIIHSFKSCFIPSYDHSFLKELSRNLSHLPTTELELQDKDFINLSEFINKLIYILDNESNNNTSTSTITYSAKLMYSLINEWYDILPSDIFNANIANFEIGRFKNLLACYFISMSQSLQAIFPEVRYLFGIEFWGVSWMDLRRVFNAVKQDNYHAIYTSRINNFFHIRKHLLYTEIVFKKLEKIDPEKFHHGRVKLQNIDKEYITNFDTTLLRPEHYPFQGQAQRGQGQAQQHGANDFISMSGSGSGSGQGQSQDHQELDDPISGPSTGGTTTGGVVFSPLTMDQDLLLESMYAKLSYNDFELSENLEKFDPTTGLLTMDFSPPEELSSILKQKQLYGENFGTSMEFTEHELEVVYKIKQKVLHS